MRARRRGFTLLDQMIVVVVFAIIAVVVLPELSEANERAHVTTVKADLQVLQQLIELYRAQHGGKSPHLNYKGVSRTGGFVNRLTQRTRADGKVTANGEYGPYLEEWPVNPFADEGRGGMIKFGTIEPPMNGNKGWYYNTDTCQLFINSKLSYD